MRSCLIPIVAVLALLIAGCQAPIKVGGQPLTEQQFEQYVVQNEAQMKAASSLTTEVVLLSLKPEQREDVAKQVYAVASAINAAVQVPNPQLDQIRDLIAAEVAKQKPEYADVSRVVLNAMTDLIEVDLANKYAEAPPDGRIRATLALLRGASAGVMDATNVGAKTYVFRRQV